MRNFLSIVVFLVLFFSESFAQITRHTSFDDRPACEESHGVWREFGNGCVDDCRAKLDKFSMCMQAVTFGCECGKGRCWNGETCVALSDYKKIFDKEWEEEQKILNEAKEKRRQEAEKNKRLVMHKLAQPVITEQQPPIIPKSNPSSLPLGLPEIPLPTN